MRGAGLILLAVVIASTLANGQTDEAIHRQQVRDEARANVDVMHDALTAHDWEAFVTAARANLKISAELGADPDLIDWLTAIAAQGSVDSYVVKCVVSGEMPVEVRETLWREYRTLSTPSVSRTIENERRRRHAEYKDRGDAVNMFIDSLFDAYQDILSDDDEAQRRGWEIADRLVGNIENDDPDTISSTEYVAIRSFRKAWDQARAVDTGARTVLALEFYRSAHDAYPDALDKLTPKLLPEVPIDPYDGEPFGYRLIDAEKDSLGRGYILYVVGIDGEDNGGERNPDLNIEALGSNSGRGFDYVINDPRD